MLPEVPGGLPRGVEEFERNYVKKHPGSTGCFHNVYHIISEDREGNVTNESFAINLLTDAGFEHMYKSTYSNEGSVYQMFLGDGVFETLDYTSTTLVHLISNTSATLTSNTVSLVNVKWVPEKESNKVTVKLCTGWFDYTVWPVDHVVTEIGLTSSSYTGINNIKYHAAVYNAAGEKSSFIKHVNEKLTITVYGRWMVPIVKLVNQSWDNGIPCLIESGKLFQDGRGNNKWGYIYANFYAYNHATYDGTYSCNYISNNLKSYDSSGTIVDHVFSNNVTFNLNVFVQGDHSCISEQVFSDSYGVDATQYNRAFIFVSKVKSPTPIPFQQDFYRLLGYQYATLEKTYCYKNQNSEKDATGQLPMTDINVTSLTMYNGQTDDWDIAVPFIQPVPYLEHGYRHLRFSIWENNYITFLNEYRDYRVFINEAPQYPIKKINDGSGVAFYTTDAYWDSSTWELIPNVDNISRAQGSKRFFITFNDHFDTGNDDYNVGFFGSWRYTRWVNRYDYDDLFPVLNVNHGSWADEAYMGYYYDGSHEYNYYYYGSDAGKAIRYSDPIDSSFNYIAQNGFLVYPESIDPDPSRTNWNDPHYTGNLQGLPYRYTIGGVDLNGNFPVGSWMDGSHLALLWNTTRGGHIICAGYNSWNKGCRVYTISSDPSQAPTYENFLYDEVYVDNPCWSHTDNGYLVVSYISGSKNVNETYVFAYDVPGENPSMYKVTGYHHAFAIDLTDYFVAIDSTVIDHLHMVIYDMANQTIHDTFDLPAGCTFQGVAGWKNFIYVRFTQSGSTETYVYYIGEQMLERTPLNLQIMQLNNYSYTRHIQRAVEGSGNIESCMILFASDSDSAQTHMLFKESDPTHPQELIRKENGETSSCIRNQKAWLGYTEDNKQLLCVYHGYRSICIDVSWNLLHGTQNIHKTWADYANTDGTAYTPIYHKGYCYLLGLSRNWNITIDGRTRNLPVSRFYRYPYQSWVALRITGTTYTPNSMMNPVRIQGDVGTAHFSSTNRDVDVGPPPSEPIIYGVKIDSYGVVTYDEDAEGFTPASIGNGVFSYGSWGNAFFKPKPCMLKSDGTVDYYLNPNDFTKKEDGTASDVANAAYDGNAMMEWPMIWYKFEKGEGYTEWNFYCSNQQVDSSYKCWCNMDCNGDIIPHFYTAIYNSTGTSTFRSLSGIALTPANGSGGTDAGQERTRCKANNTTSSVEWLCSQYCDFMLIYGLLVMMGQSINIASVFGRGLMNDDSLTYTTGSLNNVGLFYGNLDNMSTPIKIFGMENWYGFKWDRIAGLYSYDNKFWAKLTYGTADGTAITDYPLGVSSTYNLIEMSATMPSSYNGYLIQCVGNANGIVPFVTVDQEAAKDTYYGSKYIFSSGNHVAMVGGSADTNFPSYGIGWHFGLSDNVYTNHISTRLSCKPLLSRFPQT